MLVIGCTSAGVDEDRTEGLGTLEGLGGIIGLGLDRFKGLACSTMGDSDALEEDEEDVTLSRLCFVDKKEDPLLSGDDL